MKNSNLFLLVASLFAMVSCGTVTHTAFYGPSQLRNGIYYSSEYAGAQTIVQEQMEEPVALAEGETYESRLTKFDSPVYNVNIIIDDPYTWWGYSWYHPYYYSWYRDYMWNYPWYSSWYAGSYWNRYWFDIHWGHRYWYGYYPHYGPIHHPVYHPAPGRPGKPVYYGKRGSSPSYRDTDRGYVSGGHTSPMGRPSQGSVTRRPQNQNGKPVVRGQNTEHKNTQGSQTPQYRRTTERSSSSYNNNNSFGVGRNSHVNNGGGARSGGSSGSYRRR